MGTGIVQLDKLYTAHYVSNPAGSLMPFRLALVGGTALGVCSILHFKRDAHHNVQWKPTLFVEKPRAMIPLEVPNVTCQDMQQLLSESFYFEIVGRRGNARVDIVFVQSLNSVLKGLPIRKKVSL